MAGGVSISVCVITRDEERNIVRCLESLGFASEIVVVDSGSSDRTVELATRFTQRVVHQDWLGFGPQKNHAISLAVSDWVLVLDADEWVPPELAEEIRQVLMSPAADVFEIRRETLFLGRFMTHCWSEDWTARLFRRGMARHDDRPVHERLLADPGARKARLRQHYCHDTYRDLTHYVAKMNQYSTLFANGDGGGGSVGFARLLGSPLWAFFKMYVMKRGFLDGTQGLILSTGTAYYHFMKYAKLWERLGRERVL